MARGTLGLGALASLFVCGVAGAAEAAYYHADDVARASRAFQGAAEAMAPAFEERMAQVTRTGAALMELEVGVGMLGDQATEPLRAYVSDTRRTAIGESMRVQRHADLLAEDYSRVFGAALERAMPTVTRGYAMKECKASGVAAMVGRTQCTGMDLNPALAAALDKDAALARELAEIAVVEWPGLTSFSAPQAPVALTGTARWVDGAALARALSGDRIAAARDAATTVAERAEEGEATAADVSAATAAWHARLAADGAALRAAVIESLARGAKKGGPADVAWCPNPRALGGCTGEDATRDVIAALKADTRFLKAVEKALPAP